MKKKKEDEEVASGDSASEHLNYDSQDEKKGKDGAITEVDKDPFFAGKDEDDNENADERRLKMTKKLIKELGEESKDKEKEDFFMNL